jgi:site-specific recombinase XerD
MANHTIPTVHIFVRHSLDCKSRKKGDTFKGCRCLKHLRYRAFDPAQGKKRLFRVPTGCSAWEDPAADWDAERAKAKLTSELRAELHGTARPEKTIREIAQLYVTQVKHSGVGKDMHGKVSRMMDRLCDFCDRNSITTLNDFPLEHLLTFRAELWEICKSPETQRNEQRRLKTFFEWCLRHRHIERTPTFFADRRLMKIRGVRYQTQPFEPADMENILAAPGQCFSPIVAAEVRAVILVQRWAGCAIIDAIGLEKTALQHRADGYHIVYVRKKTEKNDNPPVVDNVIPDFVGKELEALPGKSKKYFFWTGNGDAKSAAEHFSRRRLQKVFAKAGILDGHSHRFRDTGAVELLKATRDMRAVQKWCGHQSLQTTEKYYAPWNTAQQVQQDKIVGAAIKQMLSTTAGA